MDVHVPTTPFTGAVDASHDVATMVMASAGAVIPEIPVAVAAAAAALVENAAALLSVALALVALDAGTEIVASTLTLAVAGDDVPVTPSTVKLALAVERSAFAAERLGEETSYVTDTARSLRRADDVPWTFVIALASTLNAVAASVLKALVVGADANEIEPETT